MRLREGCRYTLKLIAYDGTGNVYIIKKYEKRKPSKGGIRAIENTNGN